MFRRETKKMKRRAQAARGLPPLSGRLALLREATGVWSRR
jgi:hypothetical protein